MTIAPWLVDIDGPHLPRLIESDAPVIRCVAGPGSGKTLGLKRRVLRLVTGKNVKPERVFVGTFTRAVARELGEKLGAVAVGIGVSTLHAHALRLLRVNAHVIGDRRMRFLLGFEKEAMLYDIEQDLKAGDHQSDRWERLRKLLSSKAERSALPEASFAGAIDRWLRGHGGMLVEEVVWMAVQALENEDIARGAYDHVIVDEYQDLTACEQRMIELMWSRKGSLVVLGDDDQSIYGFRFNHPEGVAGFSDRWQAVEDIPLPENRRCGTDIVGYANLMMAEAGSHKDPMKPASANAGIATFIHWPSLEEEIAGLAQCIKARKDTEFLVLVPRRFIGHRLAEAIGDDAVTTFHEEVLEHPLSQERFTLAALLGDPDDAVALRAWLGLEPAEAKHASKRNAPAYSSIVGQDKVGVALAKAITDGAVRVEGQGRDSVVARSRRLVQLLDAAPTDPKDAIRYLFDPALAEQLDDKPERKRRAGRDLETLKVAALRLTDSAGGPGLGKIMERLRYQIAVRLPLVEQDDHSARVRIMTLHSAKGLEAEVILAAGVADQMIPGLKVGEDREEQRRLLYVAITRAKRELVVSWPRSVSYEDVKANYIREDKGSIFTAPGGEVRVSLKRSTLVPGASPVARPGAAWLGHCLKPAGVAAPVSRSRQGEGDPR